MTFFLTGNSRPQVAISNRLRKGYQTSFLRKEYKHDYRVLYREFSDLDSGGFGHFASRY